MHKNKILIHNEALLHNFRLVKKFNSRAKILPMLKANAFGHGLENVARLLESEADGLAIVRYEELLLLLEKNIKKPIVLMSNLLDFSVLTSISASNIQITICTKLQLNSFVKNAFYQKRVIWLKVNTGMNRLGLNIEDVEPAIILLKKSPWTKKIILITHFSDADDTKSPKTINQYESLKHIAQKHSLQMSTSNSAALLNRFNFEDDWIRPGIMLYGASPISGKNGSFFGLSPAMTLSSYLLEVRKQRKGDKIGYSSTWVCKKDMLLGIIPIGYGDGYMRNLSGAPVWINGVCCPIVGRISMDYITVDLSECENPKVGDYVELWGKNLPINEVSRYASSIPNELLTHIAPRLIERSFL